MKRLFIIGAGGFGREVYGWAMDANAVKQQFEIAGFLDANPKVLDNYDYLPQIIGNPSSFVPAEQDCFVCAIGDPDIKIQVCNKLKERGACFITLVHPTAVIGPNCSLGEGCILCAGAVLTADVAVGNFVTLNVYSSIGHDVVVGDGCTLSGHVDITGGAVLGRGVLVGSHASVLPFVRIGDYAKIGAGSVALRNVPANTTVFGVPATKIYVPTL